jgi:hypothetical protein
MVWLLGANKIVITWQAIYLNAVLRGHYNYYDVTGNFLSVSAFYRHCIKMGKRYLSKRNQRASLKWDKFMGILKDNSLMNPRLPHSIFNRSCNDICWRAGCGSSASPVPWGVREEIHASTR